MGAGTTPVSEWDTESSEESDTPRSRGSAPQAARCCRGWYLQIAICAVAVLGIAALMRFAGFYVERSDLLAAMALKRDRNEVKLGAAQRTFATSRPGESSADIDSRYAIVDFFGYEDGRAMSCVNMAVAENHRRYAEVHGYAYYHETNIVRNSGQRYLTDAYFSKVHVVRDKLRRGHEWVLLVDLDAIFVDFSISLDDIIGEEVPRANHLGKFLARRSSERLVSRIPSLVFSGDTCVINSGVLLLRKSRFSEAMLSNALELGRDPEWDGVRQIGMGGENAAYAIILAGCAMNATQAQRVACYDRVDRGWRDEAFERRVRDGDTTALASVVATEMLPHVRLLAQGRFQSYELRLANFVLHYPSHEDWRKDPAQLGGLLGAMYLGHAAQTKAEAVRLALQGTSCGEDWGSCFKKNIWKTVCNEEIRSTAA